MDEPMGYCAIKVGYFGFQDGLKFYEALIPQGISSGLICLNAGGRFPWLDVSRPSLMFLTP
jgi:hypothetical protein